MNQRVATVEAWLIEQIGCPYIWGATKQVCTPAYRKSRIDALSADYPQYAEMIRNNCPRLKSGAPSCAGCRWARDGVGRLAYDCAQLSRFAMATVGIALVSGANSQWQKTAFAAKGKIENMPRDLFSLVFREDSDGRKHHVGNYMGDGWVIHAKGHSYGVVRERLDAIDKPLTHFGVPAGLYTDAELLAAGIDPAGNFPTLRRGSEGELVKSLQKRLNKEIGAGLQVDGIYGKLTEEAVKVYQKAHKLTVDGVVGPKTWAELGVLPDAPDTEPEAPDEEEETVRVPRRLLAACADKLEDLAADLRGYAGGG